MEKLIPFLQTNIFITFFYLIYKAFLEKETFHQVNRLYLFGSAVVSISIPFVDLQVIKSWFVTQKVQKIINESQLPEFVVQQSTASHLNWVLIISILYWTVTIGLISRMAYKIAHSFYKTFSPDFLDKNAFSFFGIIKIDKSLPHFSTILAHERVHVRQMHFLDLLFFEILSCILWCNPVAYFYKKEIGYLHEYLADAKACQSLPSKADYATFLVSKCFNVQPEMIIVQSFSKTSTLKRRIVMLSKDHSKTVGLLKYGIILPIVTVLFITNAISCKQVIKEETSGINSRNLVLEEKIKDPNNIKSVEITKEGEVNITLKSGEKLNKKLDKKERDDNNTSELINKQTEIFSIVENQPEFPGGISKMYKYLGENIKYPSAAQRANVSGRVFMKFIVEKDGSISNTEVLKGIGFGCDEESMRVLKSMPKWNPGMQNGKPVRVYYQMPIVYKLN